MYTQLGSVTDLFGYPKIEFQVPEIIHPRIGLKANLNKAKGPSINHVATFSEIFDPPPP